MCGDCVLDKTPASARHEVPERPAQRSVRRNVERHVEVLTDRRVRSRRIADASPSRAAASRASSRRRTTRRSAARLGRHPRRSIGPQAFGGREEGRPMSRFSRRACASEFVITASRRRTARLLGMLEACANSHLCAIRSTSPTTRCHSALSSLAASRVVLENGGGSSHLQQTCRDRNRLALQSDLLAHGPSAWRTCSADGRRPRRGGPSEGEGVFDLDSTQLLEVTKGMNAGHDMNGTPLDGATDFFMGGALFPEAEPWRSSASEHAEGRGRRRVLPDAGGHRRRQVRRRRRLPLPVQTHRRILLFKSPRSSDSSTSGGRPDGPDWITDRITAPRSPRRSDRDRIEQAWQLKDIAHGVHIMPLGSDDAVVRILEGAELAARPAPTQRSRTEQVRRTSHLRPGAPAKWRHFARCAAMRAPATLRGPSAGVVPGRQDAEQLFANRHGELVFSAMTALGILPARAPGGS